VVALLGKSSRLAARAIITHYIAGGIIVLLAIAQVMVVFRL